MPDFLMVVYIIHSYKLGIGCPVVHAKLTSDRTCHVSNFERSVRSVSLCLFRICDIYCRICISALHVQFNQYVYKNVLG